MNLRGHVTKFTQPLWSGENDVSSAEYLLGPELNTLGLKFSQKGELILMDHCGQRNYSSYSRKEYFAKTAITFD